MGASAAAVGAPATAAAGSASGRTGAPFTSRQTSITTGPGWGDRPACTISRNASRPTGRVRRSARTATGRTIAVPSTSWIPRCRSGGSRRSVDFTCPAITSRSRRCAQQPATAVTMFVRPGPVVTSAKARFPAAHSLKCSTAIPAVTSWTTGMQANLVRKASMRCMQPPPATRKQCV